MISAFFLLILLNFLVSSQAFYQNSSLIHDLQTTSTTYGSNTLSADAALWSLSSYVCSSCPTLFAITRSVTACGYDNLMIFGGPNILGPPGASTYGQYYERQYHISNDLTWNVLGLQFQLYVFTSTVLENAGNTGSFMVFKINDVLIEPRNVGYSYCESTYTNSSGIKIIRMMMLNIQYLHAYNGTNDFNLKIVSRFTNASTLHSLGLTDVKIMTLNTNVSGYTNFPCDVNFYSNGTTCLPCHSYCSSCSGPTNDQCSSCVYPIYNYYNGSCYDHCPTSGPIVQYNYPYGNYCYGKCQSGYYWAYNDSCSPTCDPPYKITWGQNYVSYCSTPCTNSSDYLYPNGSCYATCPSPLKSDVLIGNVTSIKFCLNPCKAADGNVSFLLPNGDCIASCPLLTRIESDIKYCSSGCQSNEYLYPNSSCFATCPSPLVSSEELNGAFKYCKNPCQTGNMTLGTTTVQFLYPNSTCHADCLPPLLSRTETGIKYCFTPCQSDQYLYADGNCSAACNLPLIRKVEPNTFSFCVNPCGYSGSLFLFPDGTCNSTCPYPLLSRTEPSGKYCKNPCAENNTFLNENLQICMDTCPAPSVQKSEVYAKICKFPCDNPDHYYHTMEKQCKATCEYPQQAQETPLPKLCISSLSEEEVKQVQQMANAASTAGSASDTGLMVFSVISSSDSTSACMGPLAKMLQYIRFMDIMYPEKVALMLQEQAKNTNKKGLTQKMLGSAIDTFPNHKLNGKFNTYNTRSSFFVNFWPSLFNLLVIFLGTMVIVGLTTVTKGHPKIHEILKGLTDVVKWNVFLITFCGSVDDIVLFTALEFQTLELDNSAAAFSFIVCMGMNVLAAFIFVKILNVNSKIHKSTRNTLGDEHKKLIEQQFTSYRALFECYKEYSYYQQIFLFVFILRSAIFNAVIGYFYNSPVFQATVSTLLNILMLGYLVMKRPMKKIMNLIQQIVLELVLLPFNICVLALAIMDHQEILEIERRKGIGNIIFYINLIIPMLSLGLMAAKFAVMGFELYKSWKMGKAQKKGKLKQIEVSQARQMMNNTTEEPYSIQQNLSLPLDSAPCKSLTDNTQILDLTDNSSICPESHHMSNSRLNSPVFPKMKIQRTRRHGDHQQSLFTLVSSQINNNFENNMDKDFKLENYLPSNNDLQTDYNFELHNEIHMENNIQPNNHLQMNTINNNLHPSYYGPQQYVQQQRQRQFSRAMRQQEEFGDQEIFENISMTQSEIVDGNMRREQDIQTIRPYENHQQNFASLEKNHNDTNFQTNNNLQAGYYYPRQQVQQQRWRQFSRATRQQEEFGGQEEVYENQDIGMTQSEQTENNRRREQDIRARMNSLQYNRASKLRGRIF